MVELKAVLMDDRWDVEMAEKMDGEKVAMKADLRVVELVVLLVAKLDEWDALTVAEMGEMTAVLTGSSTVVVLVDKRDY